VLVADDDAALRAGLQRILENEGLRVLTAADGNAALRAIRREHPDVVLLDVMMPAMDGFRVCTEVKADADTRLTPVVLLTALGDVEDRVRGIDAGADDFLTKPFERAELLARVRSLWRMKSYTDELERAETVLLALARSVEAKDPYTEGHCDRLSKYAAALGVHMGRGPDQVLALQRAGTLHDIGKVAVPDAILLKQGPLTEAELAVMREHPVVGERICQGLRFLRPVLPVIRHHHEHWDGSGYPDGLKGDEIPLLARILQVVDVCDALTSDRPYRRAMPWDRALQTLQDEGARGWWDPTVVDAWRGLVAAQPALVAPA
jgi:putative two-component system response regulator